MSRELFSTALLMLVLCSTVFGGVALAATPGAAATGSTYTDDVSVTRCSDSQENLLGMITGTVRSGLSAYTGSVEPPTNPCYDNVEEYTVDSEAEVARAVAVDALETRSFIEQYMTEWSQWTDQMQNPALGDARTEFATEVANGSSEIHAISEAKMAAHHRVALQQLKLWKQYLSAMNSVARIRTQAADGGVMDNVRIGYINDSGQFEYGYNVEPVTNPDVGVGGMYATNITLADSRKVSVPLPYRLSTDGNLTNISLGDTINPLNEDLLVQVYDPESGRWESVINTATINPSRSFNYSFTGTDSTPWTDFTLGDYLIQMEDSDGSLRISDSNGPITTSSVASDGEITIEFGQGETVIRTNGNDFYTISKEFVPTDIAVHNEGNTGSWGDIQNESSSVVTGYTNEFAQKHNRLETIDNDVMDTLGNDTSGMLSQMYAGFESGDLNATNIHTTSWWMNHYAETSDRGEQSWLAAQLNSLGLGLSDVQKTMTVTVQSGATVNGQELNSSLTYEGWLATESNPPNGSWTNGESYTIGSGKELENPVHILYQTEDGHWENGTYVTNVHGATAMVSSGTITIGSITNADDQEVENATQHENDVRTTNVTRLQKLIEQNHEQWVKLMNIMDEDNDKNQEDATGGGGGGDNPVASWLDNLLPTIGIPNPLAGVPWKLVIGGVVIGGVAIFALPFLLPLLLGELRG